MLDTDEGADADVSAAASGSGAVRSGSLLPCPRLIPGQQFLSFDIEKIGLKDAETYVDPYFTVSVYGKLAAGTAFPRLLFFAPIAGMRVADVPGRELGLPQDTPISNKRAELHVLFNCRVFIQTPLRELQEGAAELEQVCVCDGSGVSMLLTANAAIFFEFKHYKPREKRISVRCWSLVEMDEVCVRVAYL